MGKARKALTMLDKYIEKNPRMASFVNSKRSIVPQYMTEEQLIDQADEILNDVLSRERISDLMNGSSNGLSVNRVKVNHRNIPGWAKRLLEENHRDGGNMSYGDADFIRGYGPISED